MILAFIEGERNPISPLCLQALTFARELAAGQGMPLEAVAFEREAGDLPGVLQRHGVSRIHRVEHPRLDDYAPEAWAKALAQLMDRARPQFVLAAATDRGNEILARVAAVKNLPMAANCIGWAPGSPPVVVRQRWGGSLLEEAALHAVPPLLTVAPHAVEVREIETQMEASLETFSPVLEEKDFRVRVVAREETHPEGVSLRTASVVVGGGRGVGSADGFRVLEELASLLGAAVGGSRVATNNGWRTHAQQIGLTGNRIAPDLYIACGISGAIQHYVGCKGSKNILVINQDREAPFFRRATHGVVGDLHEVLPALIEEIRRIKT